MPDEPTGKSGLRSDSGGGMEKDHGQMAGDEVNNMIEKIEVKAVPTKPVRRENQYKKGSTGYFAYESGYLDALEDMKKLLDPDNVRYITMEE